MHCPTRLAEGLSLGRRLNFDDYDRPTDVPHTAVFNQLESRSVVPKTDFWVPTPNDELPPMLSRPPSNRWMAGRQIEAGTGHAALDLGRYESGLTGPP